MFYRISLIATLLVAVLVPERSLALDQNRTHKMWIIGHVISVGDEEFVFGTRWHPRNTVHISTSTTIICGKQTITLGGMHRDDLVEINALTDDHEMWGVRIKILASKRVCDMRTAAKPLVPASDERK